jgi:hypothetical protein
MVVHFLTSVVGLERWSDYIPVKLVQGGPENSYSGTIDVAVIPSLTADTQAWKEYIPVYLDDAGTDAWTVNAVGYIPYNYALFTDASMQLDLTNGGELDPRVTFTRTSNATVTDSTGTLVYAPHNLLTFSESFDNATWAKTNIAAAANTGDTTAPDGTSTAEKLTSNAGSAQHYLQRSTGLVSVINGLTYAFSVFVKAGTEAVVQLTAGNASAFGTNAFVNFDLTAGTTGTVGSAASNASIVAVGNGWYRISFTCPAIANDANGNFLLGFTNNNTTAGRITTFNAAGTEDFYAWGAQLNVGSLQPYYPTTRKNLLGFTQEFDNAGWTKVRSSATANTTVAPDGTLTGDSLIADTAASTTHFATQSASFTSGGVYTATLYAKQAGIRYVRLGFSATAFGGIQVAFFDLQDGVVTSTSGTVTTSIENAGNGWWRVRVTATATATASDTISINLSLNGTSSNFTGNDVDGIFLWGAQLSDSASLDPYVYNPGAAPASTAYFGPRFDYDPVTLAPKGLLIEEQRTNTVLQSEAFATTWTSSTGNPIVSVNTAIAPDGTLTADKLIEGTTNGQQSILQSNVSFPSVGQYAYSVYVKKAERFKVTLRESTSTGAAVLFDVNAGTVLSSLGGGTPAPSGSIQSVGNGWYRCTMILAQGTAGNRTVRVYVVPDAVTTASPSIADYTGDGTSGIFIWGAQLEVGAFPTSYIPTTTAAATRAADVAVMQGANFSNWYNQSEGTVFAESSRYALGASSAQYIIAEAGNTASNNNDLIQLGTQFNANNFQFLINTGGVGQCALVQPSVTTIAKYAGAYKANDFAYTRDGGAALTDATGTVPVVSQFNIGSRPAFNNTGFLNGHIRRLAFFPRRLANAELTAITS